jgi:hypothetical protein
VDRKQDLESASKGDKKKEEKVEKMDVSVLKDTFKTHKCPALRVFGVTRMCNRTGALPSIAARGNIYQRDDRQFTM